MLFEMNCLYNIFYDINYIVDFFVITYVQIIV